MIHWPELAGPHIACWTIVALAIAGVLIRPTRLPAAAWAVGGALLLVVAGLLSLSSALGAIGNGADVLLYLLGMMLLAELGRREGLFESLAGWAVWQARGSASRLFALVCAVAVVATMFMSNVTAIVVLAPAVHAAAKKAGARPLPYLFACLFVANAASFAWPIANPANLVAFGEHLPRLATWLRIFALPSIAAIAATWGVLAWLFRGELRGRVEAASDGPALSPTGRIAALGIVGVALALLTASAFGTPLGVPTLFTSLLAIGAVQRAKREAPWPLLRHVSWSVLALVAGLFVLVAGVARTGLIGALTELLRNAAESAPHQTAWSASAIVAFASNLIGNLPTGLVAGSAANSGFLAEPVRSAIAIGIDLGPGLSITGSLATILWLAALRREGERVSAWQFLRVGVIVLPVALVLALACL